MIYEIVLMAKERSKGHPEIIFAFRIEWTMNDDVDLDEANRAHEPVRVSRSARILPEYDRDFERRTMAAYWVQRQLH